MIENDAKLTSTFIMKIQERIVKLTQSNTFVVNIKLQKYKDTDKKSLKYGYELSI